MELATIIFLGLILLGIGYLLGRARHMPQNTPLSMDRVGKVSSNTPIEVNLKPEVPEMALGKEDIINHDGVGIVMRPSAEELEKFAEPQAIREAKRAVAETLKEQEEIDKATL